MRVSIIGVTGMRTLAALGALLAMAGGCGSSASQGTADGGAAGSNGGNGGNAGNAGSGGGATGCGLLCPPANSSSGASGSGSSSGTSSSTMATTPAVGGVNAPDCPGCQFPAPSASDCGSAPAIKIVYPNDTVLVPPNLNVMSVQWTPYGAPFTSFEVDFSQSAQPPNTDWRIITACKTQTVDAQSSAPSGGCELTIDPLSWSKLVGANRGLGNAMTVTVRGTTDGKCASKSNVIHMSIAEEDLLGSYYYWKSTISSAGVGGQIWEKVFGDLANSEKNVTSAVTLTAGTLSATCNGCHALSRDGKRMVVYSDDDDSDDEYSDIGGSLLDLTTSPNATELGVGVDGSRAGGQPPGFTAINPLASFYVTSNGIPLSGAGAFGATSTTSAGYQAAVPTNGWSEWNGQTGSWVGPLTVGGAQSRPTMPDWSVDGSSVVYVQPSSVALWDANGSTAFTGARQDDDHIFGGSLYTVPYMGNGAFGTPAVFLQSGGENNYYPSYSPDQPMSYVIFNRAPLDMSAGSVTGCTTGTAPMCPNDSFSNPAARLMLMKNVANSKPIDMERANGTPAASALPWSNSYPRWAPFVQNYHGNKLLWFTFSSTRDYGVRILNHKTGMYQCYPADAYQTPGGAHKAAFASECQEPQLWMAPITFTEAQGAGADPSGVAFWIPYQDLTTHNHTAQWTQQLTTVPPPVGKCTCVPEGQACATSQCGCCSGLTCAGSGTCISAVQ